MPLTDRLDADYDPDASGRSSAVSVRLHLSSRVSRRSFPVRGSEEEVMPMDRPCLFVSARVLSLCWRSLRSARRDAGAPAARCPPASPTRRRAGRRRRSASATSPTRARPRGMAALYGNKGPGALLGGDRTTTTPGDNVTYGIPAPGTANLGAPTDNKFGAPGTAGTNDPSLGHSRTRQFTAEFDPQRTEDRREGLEGDTRRRARRRYP